MSILSVDTPTFTALSDTEIAAALTADATYEVDGNAITPGGTIPAGDHVITANITVDFPYDGLTTPLDNDTQSQTAVLDAITVTATQSDNH